MDKSGIVTFNQPTIDFSDSDIYEAFKKAYISNAFNISNFQINKQSLIHLLSYSSNMNPKQIRKVHNIIANFDDVLIEKYQINNTIMQYINNYYQNQANYSKSVIEEVDPSIYYILFVLFIIILFRKR